jgi:hypothetical protein
VNFVVLRSHVSVQILSFRISNSNDTIIDNEKENWRILTSKEMNEILKKRTITKTWITLVWACTENGRK